MAKAKHIVRDLFEPNPWVYWVDFLFSDILGWVAFVIAVQAESFSWYRCVAILVAGLALYRAVLFVHELSHLKKDTFRAFHAIWNLICGFPLMLPSFIYCRVHIDHHKQKLYGTSGDPEYFPFALSKPYRIILFPLTMFVAPVFFVFRYLVVAPLSYLAPRYREPLWVSGSSLAAGGPYRRPLPDAEEKRQGFVQELMTFIYAATWFALMILGKMPWKVLEVWYVVAVIILVTNAFRSLVAHCDRNPPNHVMTFDEQFLDSTNIQGNPLLTPLWAPVGLRYHATHHAFPGMPYHRLAEAHRRLMRDLPKGNPYPLANRSGMWAVLGQLWKESSEYTKEHLKNS